VNAVARRIERRLTQRGRGGLGHGAPGAARSARAHRQAGDDRLDMMARTPVENQTGVSLETGQPCPRPYV
jgi:hypothetical protein